MSLGFEITEEKDQIIDLQYSFILTSFLPFQYRGSSRTLASFSEDGGVTLHTGFKTKELNPENHFTCHLCQLYHLIIQIPPKL